MFNLEHEIEIKENKKILHFLGIDYFHDSIIKEIKFINKKDLEITIFCIREWDNVYQKYINEKNMISYKNLNLDDENYIYKLLFKDCVHFELNNSGCYVEYLNGRFKNSEIVEKFNKKTKKYLHLRIQLSEGFTDLIFKKFNLKRLKGNLNYVYGVTEIIPFEQAIKKFKNKSIEEIRKIALKDENEKYYAIQYLMLINDKEIENIALKNINSDDLEVEMISVLALGNCSINKDICFELFNRRQNYNDNLYKKMIDEAIEKINERVKKGKIKIDVT